MNARGLAGGLLLLGLSFDAAAQTYSRTDTIVYHDNLSKWVIGQTASTTNTNTGSVAYRVEYDPVSAVPLRYYGTGKIAVGGVPATPGLLKQTLTYNTDGTVASVKDANNNITTLGSWNRGIPQSVGYPGGVSQSAVVNAQGWITSVTDENGFKTCYAYDTMGRVTQVTYPSETVAGVCDGSTWNPTTIAFVKVAGTEYGIAPGHWRQTTSTGNGHKVSYFDGQWRPLVTHEYDAANVAGTQRFQRFTYDHEGRATFASYPGTTDALTTGVRTVYDSLGRVASTTQDSELSPLTTSTEYLDGFQTRITNPRGLSTTTKYMVYDVPTFDMPVEVREPEGRDTAISRDVFGKPRAIDRGGNGVLATRRYVYDEYQELCKTIEPETGATVLNYDAASNVIWSARGLTGSNYGDTLQCSRNEAATSGRAVVYGYDGRNRPTYMFFPDHRGDQSWTYTPDGLVATAATDNDGSGLGRVDNVYSYNKRRLLVGESVGQPAWYSWSIGYGYDANASLATHVYPTGLAVNYAPNALGQATQAGSYATGVQYFPNGAIKQFTYGNGIVHQMIQNARQLPKNSVDGSAISLEYVFDANANVQYIYDWTNPALHRYMNYDGLDRLISVGSQVFGGDHWHRFTYDALDNMTSWKLAGVKDYANYIYEPGTNRLGMIQNSAGAGIVGLGYDVQGNLANKNGQLYTFDYGNRLRGTTNLEWYRYDGMGRRVLNWRWSESGVLSMYSQSGQIMYDENYRTSGRKTSTYIYLAGSLVAVNEWNFDIGTTATKYQHTDALGSPVAVTNHAGTVIDRTNWEPYGAAIGKPNYDGVGYTGHVMDGATGLTYMQQRYYDPNIGRFLSVDPVTAYSNPVGAFNRYWYANNNPYRFKDPDGRQSKEVERQLQEMGEQIISGIDESATPSTMTGSQRLVSGAFGALDIAEAGGKLVSHATGTLMAIASPVDGPVMDVAGGLMVLKDGTQMIDGVRGVLSAMDGKPRPTVLGQTGEIIGGETGKAVGEVASIAVSFKGRVEAATRLYQKSGADMDLVEAIAPLIEKHVEPPKNELK